VLFHLRTKKFKPKIQKITKPEKTHARGAILELEPDAAAEAVDFGLLLDLK